MNALKRNLTVTIITAAMLSGTAAWATSVSVVGLFKDKAIVSIDGGKPRTLSVGQTMGGVKLLAADSDSASFDVDGTRRTLGMGQSFAGGTSNGERQSVSLTADVRGHFTAAGSLNGYPVSFMVDTGATVVAMSSAVANRIGIDYRKHGRPGMASTPAGYVNTYDITLGTVQVGGITLHNVAGSVIEGSHPREALLGMSFLGQLDMKRDNEKMELSER